MSIRRVLWASLSAVMLTGRVVGADEPLTELKPPQVLMPVEIPAGYFRQSRMAVWDYYGVDRQGYFRPRVVWTPEAQFFLYNAAPYPMASVKPMSVIPLIVD